MTGTWWTSIPESVRILAIWFLTRMVLLLFALKVLGFPGPDVTSDLTLIYQDWYAVLRTGAFPYDDVTWQYPPAAALAVLSPALLPFLDYTSSFVVLSLFADALVLGLLQHAGARPGKTLRGAWVWVVGVPLLGPTAYARYDLMVTAVAVAGLFAGARHPRTMGALAGLGALMKVWPVLLLTGTPRGRATWRSRAAAAAVGAGLLFVSTAAMPGALAFVHFQRDRGTEVESLGSLVFHVARHFGWSGWTQLNYGSVEFLGPHVPVVSALAQALSVLALAWLVLWRVRAGTWSASTPADAAFVGVLLFTVTSRVISPQYMLWLVGAAAVCLAFRGSPMVLPARLVLAATFVTLLEFPVWFSHIVVSDPLGVGLLLVRNGLLTAATLIAAVRLWRRTVPEPRPLPHQTARDQDELVTST